MPIWPFQRPREDQDAAALLAAVTQASRNPQFYGPGRAPDTLDGRFEVATIFAALALVRLKAEPERGALTQSFTDALFSQFDAGLREAGVGDLAVPQRMHKLASAFYGRLGAYAAALGDSDAGALGQAIGRNVLGEAAAPFAARWADRVAALAAKQAGAPLSALFENDGWSI